MSQISVEGMSLYATVEKEIPLDGYYLLKSCQAGSWYPSIEVSLRYVLAQIGANFIDDPRQSTCIGCANHIGVIPFLPIVTLNARNISLASQSGMRNVICNCPTCYSNLKECKGILDGSSAMKDRAMSAMRTAGLAYNNSVSINHVSEAFLANIERIKEKARYSLHGLRAVTHHGCHYSKVYYKEVASGNFERPTVLDRILEGFGCQVVDYPERSLCCGLGFHHIMLGPNYTRAVTRRKYAGMMEADPDLIVTMCAGCTLSLDMCQEKLLQELGEERDIPVLNISELLALLLGADPHRVAGIDMHGVPVEPLLDKIGIPRVRA
ncbi:MAG TPA: CoB--CoM heterodisulfide reductase iron-sulfur subunit B family protein [Methanomassiliicoccales archaeon]|nr:CoB--CoM heterodisulfide reductase iron-sulfur subunit B family protein [Methanomassiliicoccales archaeon]